ncbi:unnamed protein product [Closterium sp. NIES-65]|nr:unnamed protein product [Closterium sp. NIES-65]
MMPGCTTPLLPSSLLYPISPSWLTLASPACWKEGKRVSSHMGCQARGAIWILSSLPHTGPPPRQTFTGQWTLPRVTGQLALMPSPVELLLSDTRGYLDPEFITTHHSSTKTDVYSFGVVLLELLTGQRPLLYISPPALAAVPQPAHASVAALAAAAGASEQAAAAAAAKAPAAVESAAVEAAVEREAAKAEHDTTEQCSQKCTTQGPTNPCTDAEPPGLPSGEDHSAIAAAHTTPTPSCKTSSAAVPAALPCNNISAAAAQNISWPQETCQAVSETVSAEDQISRIPVDAHAGAASTKLLEDPSLGASSIHSFGVTTLADWARRMLSHGHLADIVDPRMPRQPPDFPPQLAEFADVAVSCTDPIGYRRPAHFIISHSTVF